MLSIQAAAGLATGSLISVRRWWCGAVVGLSRVVDGIGRDAVDECFEGSARDYASAPKEESWQFASSDQLVSERPRDAERPGGLSDRQDQTIVVFHGSSSGMGPLDSLDVPALLEAQ
jgi:hypothetical protein